MNPVVSFLVVSFNSEKYINNCLESILQQSETGHEIIAIDNNSTDNTISILQDFKKKSQISLILNKTNLGYGNALIIGMQKARGNYLAILNADVILDKKWTSNLLRIFSSEKTMIAHGKILLPNGEIQSTGGIMDKYGAVMPRESSLFKKCNIPENSSYFYADGSSFMIKKSIFDEINFDPKIFLYYEDVDLSWKIRMLNYEIGYSEDAMSYHDVGHSDSDMTLTKFYHITRNRIYVCLKNYSKKNLLTRIPVMVLLVFLNSIYYDISEKPTGYTKTFFKALWWNLVNTGNTIKENRKLRLLNKISDDDLDRYLFNKSVELNLIRIKR